MTQAKKGDNVKVHYTGKLNDGTVFDTSKDRHPLQFIIGEGRIIAGFEEAVVGMNRGDAKTATIAPEKGYGPRRDDMVVTVERKQLPTDMDPAVGQRLELTQTDDQKLLVTITDVTESNITLDANHPLAGQDLTFEIELVDIV